jgi:hypothetical protein
MAPELISLGEPAIARREPHEYRRIAPNLFNFVVTRPDLRSYILRTLVVDSVNCPAEGGWLLRDCKVIDGKYIVTVDGQVVGDTALDTDPSELVATIAAANAKPLILAQQLTGNSNITAHIYKQGAANYGHFIVEILPKLIHISQYLRGDINILIPQEGAWSMAVLVMVGEMLGLRVNPVVTPATAVLMDELLLLAPVAKHNTRKSHTLLALVDMLVRKFGSTGPQRDLFVGRRRAEKRAVENYDQLSELYSTRGFKVIYPAEMQFAEQIAAFSSARRIAGCLGAGMTNAAFAPHEANVFMIDGGNYDFFFWDLACLCRQQFHWYFASPIDMFQVNKLVDTFRVDTADVGRAMRQVGFL